MKSRRLRLKMAYIALSERVVLRADPDYFSSWTAFNTRTYFTRRFSFEEFALLHTLGEQPLEESLFRSCVSSLVQIKEVNDYVNVLLDTDLVVINQSDSGARVMRPLTVSKSPSTGISTSTPTEVEMCVTRRCNEACVHCNVSACGEGRSERQSVEFWFDVIRQCEEADVMRVTITGGEPFVRHNWDRLLDRLAEARFGKIILTNGTRILDHHFSILRKGGFTLSISLDGATESVHDQFRRLPGAFKTTIRTMERLSEEGIPFVVSSVLHDGNVEDSVELLRIGERVGARRVIIVPMAAVGRAATPTAKSHFAKSELLSTALKRIRDAAESSAGPDVIIGDATTKEILSINDRDTGATAMSKRNPGLCKAGTYSMAVDEDGKVYSCLRGLQSRIYPIGDLLTDPLVKIWNSSRWNPFRDTTITPVPCRVEFLGSCGIK
jgi:AdoMet-dependent heme synthase